MPESTDSPVPENRQYLAVRFRPGDRKQYTYHNDGEPVAVGEFIKVPDRSGDGWNKVECVGILDKAPPYATKPITGKFPPPEPKQEGADNGGN